MLEQNKIVEHIHNTFGILLWGKSKMKSTVAPTAQSKFPVKVICCIDLGSKSSACCLLKSIAITL